MTDGELLGRFLSRRDEAAFDRLVQRHGPMVRLPGRSPRDPGGGRGPAVGLGIVVDRRVGYTPLPPPGTPAVMAAGGSPAASTGCSP
jgi:hypothetical protein